MKVCRSVVIPRPRELCSGSNLDQCQNKYLPKMSVRLKCTGTLLFLIIFVVCGCAGADTQLTTSRSENQTAIRIVDPLTNVTNGISSGKIIIENDTLHILHFRFDGDGSNIQFEVGKGPTILENSTIVPVSQNISNSLDQEVNLPLANGVNIDDIDWLAVWDSKEKKLLGYVFVKNVPQYPPQTFSLRNEVTSGPVVLVDKKTLYIPNFTYKGGYQNASFWVGNGTEPGPDGVAIPDEKGSSNNLGIYESQTIYLHLPGNITTDNIDYFGVWSIDKEHSLGSVPIKEIKGVPEAMFTKNITSVSSSERLILRLPKCCPSSSILTDTGCTEMPSVGFTPGFNVYDHNETHFENISIKLDVIKFVPYVSILKCPSGKYPLDEINEEFAILKNGSLLVKGSPTRGVLPQTKFCVEYLGAPEGNMSILVCAPETQTHTAMFAFYMTFTIISTLCFAATFIIYSIWLKFEDVHRKCFTAYALAMTITFLSLLIVQTGVQNKGCEVLGFLFQISMIASFTLLGILCVDIYIIIRYIDEDIYNEKRIRWYLYVGIAIPLLSLVISLFRNLTPDVPNSFFKPQYQRNNCYFDEEEQRYVSFYVPIGLSVAVSLVCLILAKLKIVEYDKNSCNYYWLSNEKLYKFMWRKHLIIFLTSLMWCIEAVIRVQYGSANILYAIDNVEACQGIFVLFLFVVNKQTRVQLQKIIQARKRRNVRPVQQEGDLTTALNGSS